MPIKIIFFGSTSDSVIVLNKLFETSTIQQFNNLTILAVITPPPKPVGRKQVLTPTPVEVWAKEHHLLVFSFPNNPEKSWLFADDDKVITTLQPLKPDLLISASFGQKIPWSLIKEAPYGGLNIHPSLLPRWRGADPVPWAILTGDATTGVTVVTLSEQFDQGLILAQQKVPIVSSDFADPLRTKLFTIGASLLGEIFIKASEQPKDALTILSRPQQNYQSKQFLPGAPNTTMVASRPTGEPPTVPPKQPYARRLKREDGFIPWDLIQAAMEGAPVSTIQSPPLAGSRQEAGQYNNITIVRDYLKFHDPRMQEKSLGSVVERFFRALHPWPGIWTEVNVTSDTKQVTKRLKILACHVSPVTYHLSLDTVQLEGKKPVSFVEFNRAYNVFSSAHSLSPS